VQKSKALASPELNLTNTKVCGLAWIVFSLVTVSRPHLALAGVPTDQVRATVDQVLTIVQNPALKSADKRQDRREQLSKVIASRFDFAEMARRSLGAEWRRLTPSQQQQFVELFTDLLRDAYVGDIESYKGEKIIYTRETQEERYAVVQTILRSPEGTEYTIDYRLHLVDQQWKVYDLVIENVSIVNNYRSQFARVINKSSYEGLIRALKEKTVSKQN
jgi:phospholipid transport system substrate-binding protein